jgi:hypothetical protein
MTRFFYELSRAWAFRKIEHDDLKIVIHHIPLIIAAGCLAAILLLPVQPKAVGDGSLTRYLISLLSILPGFFIAALAAISTFAGPHFDQVMSDPAPRLSIRTGGTTAPAELTMRLFLSYMFAYLTVLSFAAALTCIAAETLVPSVLYWIKLVKDAWWQSVVLGGIRAAYLFIILWLVSNIAITTLYGMYFLIERMHRPRS